MLPLILTFVFLFVGLAVLIYITTQWGQGYFYESTVDGVAWRSVALAGAVTAFFGLWAIIENKAPGKFDSLFSFSARESRQFDHLWSERKGPTGTTETKFTRRGNEYFNDAGRPWRRADADGIVMAVIVEIDGEKRRFNAKLAPGDKFIVDSRNQVADVQYIEEGGRRRVMTESNIGRLTHTRMGSVFLNMLFNLAFFLVWMAGFWFLLEFQWQHALVIGFAFWLASVTLLLPAVQSRVH
jgi:hypothetical protein